MKLDEHPIQTFHTRLSTLPRRYHVLICLILLTITCAYLWDIPLHRYFVYGLLPHPDSQTSYIHILQPIHMPNVNTDASSPTYTLDSGRTLLYAASRDSHEKYARAWGHSYTVDDSDYVADRQRHGGVAGNRLMNKLLALQRVLEGELDEPEWSRNDWIFLTDGDTLILDPAIPLEAFLPPGDRSATNFPDSLPAISPPPMIIGNQDGNGFNDGAIFIRIHPRTLSFLNHTLSLEYALSQAIERLPSDQHLLGHGLQQPENADVADAFYEIPMMWVNEFWLDRDEGSQAADGVVWTPQLQLHLCNRRWIWSTPNWSRDVIEKADVVYSAAFELGGGAIKKRKPPLPYFWIGKEMREKWTSWWEQYEVLRVTGEGLRMMSRGREAAQAASLWWIKAESGIANITFTDV